MIRGAIRVRTAPRRKICVLAEQQGGWQMDEKRPHISGVEVREEDLEPQRGLKTMSWVFRGSAAVIFLLAIYQFIAWWLDPPPGGVGTGVLVGDTIRLIVFAALLWAAGNVGILIIKIHYDVRAGRI